MGEPAESDRAISSELELRPLLTRVVGRAYELLGADKGVIGPAGRVFETRHPRIN